jgi:hypothetical protein
MKAPRGRRRRRRHRSPWREQPDVRLDKQVEEPEAEKTKAGILVGEQVALTQVVRYQVDA